LASTCPSIVSRSFAATKIEAFGHRHGNEPADPPDERAGQTAGTARAITEWYPFSSRDRGSRYLMHHAERTDDDRS
jgi:hypothetical protein